ncbi:MAG: DUF58 domain-containing protein, partial [Myxococcaceae bacterium]
MSGSGPSFDLHAVERAAQGLRLALPRGPHRGRIGEVRAASTGASMEIHDFRPYHPGDDLRQIDWNAVARTGDLVLRVRQEEVSPRVEVLLDGSRSMALTPEKSARARELALLFTRIAARQGLDPAFFLYSAKPERTVGEGAQALLARAELDGEDDLASALRRAPPLRPCGVRIVISDLLFETELGRMTEWLSRGASSLAFVQLLDAEDLAPVGGFGAQLVDVERDAALERVLSPAVLRAYHRRLDEHQQLLRAAASRVGATLLTVSAALDVAELAR